MLFRVNEFNRIAIDDVIQRIQFVVGCRIEHEIMALRQIDLKRRWQEPYF
ncbi:hypothetical protein PBN151_0874 [Paenibacillus sp. NAIST15-1]|nr:hypothetical protein PBN151_0874 [Paenibacillus sp. NAIST15-1]